MKKTTGGTTCPGVVPTLLGTHTHKNAEAAIFKEFEFASLRKMGLLKTVDYTDAGCYEI